MRLDGKVAIVTGAGRGIGRAYARALAKEGARVCIAELRSHAAETVAEEIRTGGGKAIAVATDVSREQDVVKMAQATADAFGGIDILVNNAALMAGDIADWAPSKWDPLTGPLEQWNQLLAVNVTGPLLTTRAVVPFMKLRGKGKIINQSSMGAYVGGGAYGLTKLAVISLTRMFATQLAPFNINVNAISPGFTVTEGTLDIAGITSPEEAEKYAAKRGEMIPLRRAGRPEDMAKVLIFLASTDSDYIAGETICVDGAWIARVL